MLYDFGSKSSICNTKSNMEILKYSDVSTILNTMITNCPRDIPHDLYLRCIEYSNENYCDINKDLMLVYSENSSVAITAICTQAALTQMPCRLHTLQNDELCLTCPTLSFKGGQKMLSAHPNW